MFFALKSSSLLSSLSYALTPNFVARYRISKFSEGTTVLPLLVWPNPIISGAIISGDRVSDCAVWLEPTGVELELGLEGVGSCFLACSLSRLLSTPPPVPLSPSSPPLLTLEAFLWTMTSSSPSLSPLLLLSYCLSVPTRQWSKQKSTQCHFGNTVEANYKSLPKVVTPIQQLDHSSPL